MTTLYQYFYKKLQTEMRLIYLTEKKPKKIIKLDPLDPEDLNIDLDVVCRWSEKNRQLYQLLISNGMAQFICNKEFLEEFYTGLMFMGAGIRVLDQSTHRFRNLRTLNLVKNNIAVLENIPQSLKQLYIDFNHIQSINLPSQSSLQLLSISHNKITDTAFKQLIKRSPQLRCLNISYNRIENIREFVAHLKKLTKLKVLICRNNPISMLALYWEYITSQIVLQYFDNVKYVKPEPVKEVVEPKEQKKEEKKDQKKDAKKDTKKGGKVQQKPVQEQKKPEPKPQPPKVKTQQDFKQCRLKVQVTVLQNLSGTVYDSSIFPQQNLNIKKTQTCFWTTVQLLNKKLTTQQTKISMDSIVPDGEINRINFQLVLTQTIDANLDNLQLMNKGIIISIWKEEPQVQTDAETGEQKVVLDDKKEIKMKLECVGGTYVDLEPLWPMKKKEIFKNSTLFKWEAVSQPLFRKPLQNEAQLISKHRIQFDTKLAQLQQQKRKKQEQQQAAKAQKKGGKDSKKAPAKKQAKKDSKQPVAEKKAVQKCTYPSDPKQYRYLGEQKMYKCLKQKLGVKVTIQ